jgi:hypothetical protein
MAKKFPPYGKQLFELRKKGKIPSKLLMLVFSWKLAKAYPRIVVTDDVKPHELEFGYLAGIPCQIIFSEKEAHMVNDLAEEVLKVKPSFLSTFGLHLLDVGATRILKPLE